MTLTVLARVLVAGFLLELNLEYKGLHSERDDHFEYHLHTGTAII